MKKIAVIMTVHNRKAVTLKCLEKLYSLNVPEDIMVEVWLTDDGCTDGTAQAVSENYPQVHIIKGTGDLFWTRGMHLAWNRASKENYDYYLWLNDDTYPYKNALNEVLECAEITSSKAIIAGPTQSKEGKCTYGLRNTNGILMEPNGALQKSVGYLNGNFVLVPKAVYDVIGNFDPYYLHAGGDIEYGLVAREKNIPVYLAREYVGICESHPSLPKCFNPEIPLLERLRHLNKPTGMPLKMLFYSDNKHFGLSRAIFHVVTTIFHCLIPSLWLKLKK